VSQETEERTREMKKLHQQIKAKIGKANEMYKARAKTKQEPPRGLVWLYLRKERFPSRRKNKLMPNQGPS